MNEHSVTKLDIYHFVPLGPGYVIMPNKRGSRTFDSMIEQFRDKTGCDPDRVYKQGESYYFQIPWGYSYG